MSGSQLKKLWDRQRKRRERFGVIEEKKGKWNENMRTIQKKA